MRGVSREQQKLMDRKGYIAPAYAAELLHVHVTTVYRWIRQGKLQAVHLPERQVFLRKSQIAQRMKERASDRFGRVYYDHIKWLLGEEVSGECRVCALPIPLAHERCFNCVTIDSGAPECTEVQV